MSYICDICREEFNHRDEVTFLCGDVEVTQDGDVSSIFCNICREKLESVLKEGNKFKVTYLKRDGRTVDHYETVTLKKASHYNKDLFIVEFEEWNGSYSMTISQLESYYNDANKENK